MSATIVDQYADIHDDEKRAFILGVTMAYRDVLDAVGKAMESPAGITKAFTDIREQYQNVTALIAVEGVCE